MMTGKTPGMHPDVPYQKHKKKRPNLNIMTVLRTGLLLDRLELGLTGHE